MVVEPFRSRISFLAQQVYHFLGTVNGLVALAKLRMANAHVPQQFHDMAAVADGAGQGQRFGKECERLLRRLDTRVGESEVETRRLLGVMIARFVSVP